MAEENNKIDLDESKTANDDDVFGETKKKRPSVAIIIIAIIVMLMSASGGLYITGGGEILIKKAGIIKNDSDSPAISKDEQLSRSMQPSNTLKMNEMIVNVIGHTENNNEINRFLKIGVSIVYDPSHQETIENREEFIRDSFLSYLRQLQQNELRGSMGLALLRNGLIKRARTIVSEEAISDILITELLIQ